MVGGNEVMINAKPKYEMPKIVPISELAEAVGAGDQCSGGSKGFPTACGGGSNGYSGAS
jgi:hypothetical protein